MKRAALLLISALLLLVMNGPAFPRMTIGEKIYPFPHIDALNVDNTYPGEISLELKDAKDYDKFRRKLEWDGWRQVSAVDSEDVMGDESDGFVKGDMCLGIQYHLHKDYPPPSLHIIVTNDRIHLSAKEKREKAKAKKLIEAHMGKKVLAIFTNDPCGAFRQMGMASYWVVWDSYDDEEYVELDFLIYENQVIEIEPGYFGREHAVFDVDRDGEQELLAIVEHGRYFGGVFQGNGIQFYAHKLVDDPENPGKKTLEMAYHSHWDHPRQKPDESRIWFYGFDSSDPDGVRLYEGKYVSGELVKTKDLGQIRLNGKQLETEYFTSTIYDPIYDGE